MRLYPIIHHFTRHDRELINTTSTRGSLGKEGAILQSEVERDLRSTLNSPAVVERLNRLSTETGLSIDTLKSYATIAIAGYAKASYRLSKQQPPSHINAIVTACLYDVYILARTLHRFGFKKSNSDAQLYALLSRFSPHALSVLIEKISKCWV
jgi:hypothetical protein